jgi:hypothetical protein
MLQLNEIERLEDIFETLCVKFEQHVVDVHRMRILRRFGQELVKIDELRPRRNEDEERALSAAALEKIYDQCRRGMREPVFAIGCQKPQLVQLRRPSPKE